MTQNGRLHDADDTGTVD